MRSSESKTEALLTTQMLLGIFPKPFRLQRQPISESRYDIILNKNHHPHVI